MNVLFVFVGAIVEWDEKAPVAACFLGIRSSNAPAAGAGPATKPGGSFCAGAGAGAVTGAVTGDGNVAGANASSEAMRAHRCRTCTQLGCA